MTSMSSTEALAAAVDLARAAAQAEAGDEPVGGHVGTFAEDDAALTHLFEADKPGYRGWRWAVTVSCATADDVTVSEVVLLPGPAALTAPAWVPWQQRVRAGDLGVGDLMPTAPDDPRLVPGYLLSDDPAVEEVAHETGLGRERVLSRDGRLDAARRWQDSEFGPRSDMARSAPAHCGTCGFYLPVAGSLRAAFGVCGNDISPADGRVVHAEYGCGAHSEVEVEQVSPVLVADLIYDDAELDIETAAPVGPETPPVAEPPTAPDASAAGDAAAGDSESGGAGASGLVAEPPVATAPDAPLTGDAVAGAPEVPEADPESGGASAPGPVAEPSAAVVPDASAAGDAVAGAVEVPEADSESGGAGASGPVAEPSAAVVPDASLTGDAFAGDSESGGAGAPGPVAEPSAAVVPDASAAGDAVAGAAEVPEADSESGGASAQGSVAEPSASTVPDASAAGDAVAGAAESGGASAPGPAAELSAAEVPDASAAGDAVAGAAEVREADSEFGAPGSVAEPSAAAVPDGPAVGSDEEPPAGVSAAPDAPTIGDAVAGAAEVPEADSESGGVGAPGSVAEPSAVAVPDAPTAGSNGEPPAGMTAVPDVREADVEAPAHAEAEAGASSPVAEAPAQPESAEAVTSVPDAAAELLTGTTAAPDAREAESAETGMPDAAAELLTGTTAAPAPGLPEDQASARAEERDAPVNGHDVARDE